MLRDAALALRDKASVPPGVQDASIYRVRAVSTEVPDHLDWVESVRELVTVTQSAA